ncbi:MAG: sigma-70 family RNA polymerase sigma factor [Gemmatimonadaceae bacterium]
MDAAEPSENTLAGYLREIARIPLLSQEDEMALARRARNGDRIAFEALVGANLRFVVTVARRYPSRWVSLSDRIAEGNLGLLRAAEKFNPSRGARFVTYAAYWIRQAIGRAVGEQSRLVRVPREALRAANDSTEDQESFRIADSQRRWKAERTRMALRPALSLDTLEDDDASIPLAEMIAVDVGRAADAAVETTAVRGAIEQALATLSDRDGQIVRLHFGLDRRGPLTVEEIATELGVPVRRVEQRLALAIARLRQGEAARTLLAFAS